MAPPAPKPLTQERRTRFYQAPTVYLACAERGMLLRSQNSEDHQHKASAKRVLWAPRSHLIAADRSEIAKENEKSGMAEGVDVDSGNGENDSQGNVGRDAPRLLLCVFSVTARGPVDNGLSSKAPPSTQLLQVVGRVGDRSRQWFQKMTEKITGTNSMEKLAGASHKACTFTQLT
ncbi:unnamed protein product [Rangifer tarandus platyrhynchus]|uniref:Uncharacterized protein n=1 Tax=Rangifer tarandus platyrhynchus TaxID=3082113 RepID=A0AC60A8A6_RANTA